MNPWAETRSSAPAQGVSFCSMPWIATLDSAGEAKDEGLKPMESVVFALIRSWTVGRRCRVAPCFRPSGDRPLAGIAQPVVGRGRPLFFSMQWIAAVKETVQRHGTASSPTALGQPLFGVP